MYPLDAMVYESISARKKPAPDRADPPGVDPTNALSSVESTLRAQDYSITALSGKKTGFRTRAFR
jgi:hypothetical protein